MGNVYGNPRKAPLKERLFVIGLATLEQQGWKVERIPGLGKSSVRRITKGGKSRTVSVRTSQGTWIAFPRNEADTGWGTLPDVDLVLAVCVDDRDNPKFAQVHLIDAVDIRKRFDRAYAARKSAGQKVTPGHGMWVPLYYPDSPHPVSHVGGGAGIDHPPIARVPLATFPPATSTFVPATEAAKQSGNGLEPISIDEAKRRLAVTFGVPPSNIKITVEA